MSSPPDRRSAAARAACALFLLASAGCAERPGGSALMRRADATGKTAGELRSRVRALAAPFSGRIEEAADGVRAHTDDLAVRERALLWKIHVVPALQAALFQPDPMAALLDSWGLTLQLRGALDDAARGLSPGERQAAVATLETMTSELEALAAAARADGDASALRGRLEAWVRDHPLGETAASRAATAAELARFEADAPLGLRRGLALLDETRDDLAARADVYAAFLPKQARWEAELLVSRLLAGPELRSAFPELAAFADAAARATATVESLPAFATGERVAVLEAIRREREAVFADLHREIDRTFTFVSEERLRIFRDHLAGERRAILEAVTAERVAALEALHRERVETTADADRLVTALVDRLFARAALLVALAIAGFALPVAWLGFRIGRARPSYGAGSTRGDTGGR